MTRRLVKVGPLLDGPAFGDLADQVAGKTAYFLRPQTRNVGTEMAIQGAIQFFRDNDVRIANDWERDELPEPSSAIQCLIYGGGMVGTIREKGSATRKWLVADYLSSTGLPVVCLPMTHMGSEGEPKPPGEHVMFARESKSLKYLPGSVLAPDMAFYYQAMVPCHETDSDTGVFLRADPLSFVNKHWQKGLGDPLKFAKSLDEYFDLASRFERIVTDRLMFAVCGLLLERKVTLMPDSSGKNKAVYDDWLRGVGCQWSDPGVMLQ